MTLYRQLVIFTLVLFFILFTGTWLAKLESTRSFLVEQLESHAQDTATSLGVSISQYSMENDMPAIESLINAVFDRGYYRIIRYADARGKILIDRQLDVTIGNVPSWFIRMVSLKTPEASANVMAGWLQAGSIYVKSHPGYAYKTLWESVVRMTAWYIACLAIVLIAGGFGLRLLLQPLALVEHQAEALARKEYEVQEHLPRTKELRSVVETMNRMTVKVKEMFGEQAAIAEGLRRYAYFDGLTGVGNRRFFESQITAQLDRQESRDQGVLLLVQINELGALNQQKGFQAGDELLQRAGALLQQETVKYPGAVLARLTGGDFGIFMPGAAPWQARSIAEAVCSQLVQLAVEKLTLTDNAGNVGGVTYDNFTSLGRLLSGADLALRAAQQAGPNSYEIHEVTGAAEKMPLGQQQWKELFDHALTERRIALFCQPVVSIDDRNRLLHLEIFSRLRQEDGSLLPAGLFLPFAEHHDFIKYLDRIVLEDVMGLDVEKIKCERVAVNLSPASLQHDSFRRWLLYALQKLPARAPRINFEFPEFSALQHLETIRAFSSEVRKSGHFIGLDHYGRSFSHLGYLKSLRPDYVKIDRAFIDELKDEESDSRFFIGSLCAVAHSIDITVIGEGVENEQQWKIMQELNLDAIQGFIIARPKPLGEKVQEV